MPLTPEQEAELERLRAKAAANSAPTTPNYDGLTRSQYEMRGITRAAGQGATLGFGDEIEAWVRSKQRLRADGQRSKQLRGKR